MTLKVLEVTQPVPLEVAILCLIYISFKLMRTRYIWLKISKIIVVYSWPCQSHMCIAMIKE